MMLGSGSPMCQFMDASLCDSGADAGGHVRSTICCVTLTKVRITIANGSSQPNGRVVAVDTIITDGPGTEPYERQYRMRLPPQRIGERCCLAHQHVLAATTFFKIERRRLFGGRHSQAFLRHQGTH
jgi:hypothetical protein